MFRFASNPEGSSPRQFPGGSFRGAGQVVVVGSSWGTWRPQVNGKHLLFAPTGRYQVNFREGTAAVVVKAEPNNFDAFPVTVSAFGEEGDRLGSFTRKIVGNAGAAFIGLRSRDESIQRLVITSPPEAAGFAFSDLTWSGVKEGSCAASR